MSPSRKDWDPRRPTPEPVPEYVPLPMSTWPRAGTRRGEPRRDPRADAMEAEIVEEELCDEGEEVERLPYGVITRNNTRVFLDDMGFVNVRLHQTVVVRFNEDIIILNSGGWQTVTTQDRINAASSEFDLGFGVFREDYRFYVQVGGYHEGGPVFLFEDCMFLRRGPTVRVY